MAALVARFGAAAVASAAAAAAAAAFMSFVGTSHTQTVKPQCCICLLDSVYLPRCSA